MSTAVFVIAKEVFRDEEYEQPVQVLERAGVQITTASTQPGECIGKLGARATATMSVEDASTLPWDAVVFVGGAGAASFFDDPAAHALARAALDRGAVLAAICIAPSTLAHAGLLDGVRATAFSSQEDDLKLHGAIWTGAPVEIDGRIVTANGPDAARRFGEAIAGLLAG